MMWQHSELGTTPFGTSRRLKGLIDNGGIVLGGNKRLKIYGRLNCRAGQWMSTANRVFFSSQQEAIGLGYRPCGICMKPEYLQWKQAIDN